jgi:serine/threonine protein kinase
VGVAKLAGDGDRLVGAVLDGRYRIDRVIGAGAMGTVYSGIQISIGRDVAIKVMNPESARNPELVRRFLREARLSSHLAHPNAVSVLDFGHTRSGVHYLVMELLHGRTLEEILGTEGRLHPERVVHIGLQIGAALLGAHHISILHRDLKPANIVVLDGPGDRIKVVDFGIAKSVAPDRGSSTITQIGSLLGTPAYMPPEMLMTGSCDHRGDLYSLGVILYQLASGRVPFAADTIPALIAMMNGQGAVPPEQVGIPPALAQVVTGLIARDPDRRYRDAAEVLAALGQIANRTHLPTPAPAFRYTPSASVAPAPRRLGFGLACAAAATLAACGLAVGLSLI